MIPAGLTREHILAAMKRIDREGIPPWRSAWKFEVRHEERAYTPKLLISIACEAAFGRALPSDVFTGGSETNRFLQRLGFIVAVKGGDPLLGTHTPQRTPTVGSIVPPEALSQEQLETLKQQLLCAARLYTWKDLYRHDHLPPVAAGVYAWFFTSIPPRVPTERCFQRDGMTLFYVGISPGRRASAETLRSRLRFHYQGHAEGSTLRLTLGCLLEHELGTVLRRSGKRLIFGGAEKRLSQWMADNTAVTWVEVQTPRPLEEYLLRTLNLPLNIEGNQHHPFYDELRDLRDKARTRAEELPDLKRR